MKRPAKVPSLVYIKHPKVGVVEKKRHKDQRILTTSMLVVCIIGNMNNEQYGIISQAGVYVSLIIKYSQIHVIILTILTIISYSFHQLDVYRYRPPPFLYSTTPVQFGTPFSIYPVRIRQVA